jgi:5-methylcytosine-specific restriction endonuclease McrA
MVTYVLRQDVLYRRLKRHNQLNQLVLLVGEVDQKIVDELQCISREIALVLSGFMCEKCKKTTELQTHHIIITRFRQFTNYRHFLSMRNHYANIIILCDNCHKQWHVAFHQSQPPLESQNINIDKIIGLQGIYYEKKDEGEKK